MPPTSSRATHIVIGDRRHELVTVVDRAMSQVQGQVEGMALYMLVCAFWGLILYLTLISY